MKSKLAFIALIVAALFTCSQLEVSALPKKDGKNDPKEPKTPQQPKPKVQPDLAAVNVETGIGDGDPENGFKTMTRGYVRNMGSVAFNGSRTATLWYRMPGGAWKSGASCAIPSIGVGQTRIAIETTTIPFNAQVKLVLSAGDSNPSNDVYIGKDVKLPDPK